MATEPGPLLASGRDGDIFEFGPGRVLRRTKKGRVIEGEARTIDFEAELPRLPTGKLYKRLLRDRYWEGHSTAIV